MNRSKVGSPDKKLDQQIKCLVKRSKDRLTDQKLDPQMKRLTDDKLD